MVDVIVADPRTKNHAYYLKVDLSFRVNGKQVRATRYAEVWYRTGEGNQLYRETCDVTNVRCWFATDHFFVGLPNGDIVDIFVETPKLALMRMNPDQTIHPTGRLTQIRRDQPEHPHAKQSGETCISLSDEILRDEYRLVRSADVASQMDLAVSFTRLRPGTSGVSVFVPGDFYRWTGTDNTSCKRLIGRTSANVAIER